MALNRRARIRYGVALGVSLAAIGWLIVGPLTSNIEYFRTVSEAVEERAGDAEADRRFRLAGQVVEGSVVEKGETVEFEVTDGAAKARVVHHGNLPQLFDDGVPVVCEGRWDGSAFASDRILIRHGNEYSPPDVTTTAASS